jgi:hypothetical protein
VKRTKNSAGELTPGKVEHLFVLTKFFPPEIRFKETGEKLNLNLDKIEGTIKEGDSNGAGNRTNFRRYSSQRKIYPVKRNIKSSSPKGKRVHDPADLW